MPKTESRFTLPIPQQEAVSQQETLQIKSPYHADAPLKPFTSSAHKKLILPYALNINTLA